MQLTLEVALQENKTFDNFCWHANPVLKEQLMLALNDKGERFFYLWGQTGVGKTHLLQAITQEAGHSAIYLPLSQLLEYGVQVLDGLDELLWICLDDIDCIAGKPSLEEGLFHFYNRVRDNGKSRLFISGQQSLAQLGIQLADLHSRLTWGLVFHIEELSETDKLVALAHYAKEKGFTLPEAVGQYLIRHCARDMPHLIKLLNILDKASLASKRRLTIPFAKEILNL